MSNTSINKEIIKETFVGHVIASDLEEVEDYDIHLSKEKYKRTGKCLHNLVIDEKGWLYDFRCCAVCGQGLGAI